MGALRTKATALYQQLPQAEQDTMRKIMLRMVSVEGDWAGRRVPMEDLFFGREEAPVAAAVVEQLVGARLIVKGDGFNEPAHDAPVRAGSTLRQWVQAATPSLPADSMVRSGTGRRQRRAPTPSTRP
jgi:hypothetical protein